MASLGFFGDSSAAKRVQQALGHCSKRGMSRREFLVERRRPPRLAARPTASTDLGTRVGALRVCVGCPAGITHRARSRD
jgi:hypothetical protein